MTKESFSPNLITLKKLVGFYEEVTIQGARIKNQLRDLKKQERLVKGKSQAITITFILREKRKELRRIELLKKNLEEKFKILLETQGKNLTTLKGISTVLAAKILAHSRGIDRFSNINKFVKYAGIAPLENSSGRLKKHTKNTKGNRCLNTALYLVALNQLRWNQKAKDYFEKKIKEGKTKKQALRCLTKRVACIVYGMLKSKEDYRG
jgi:transposase